MATSSRSSSPAKSQVNQLFTIDNLSPTAYTGYDGNLCNIPSVQLDQHGFEDLRRPHSKTTITQKDGLGSRLLSNAHPAAAALSRSGSVLHSRAKSWLASAQRLNTSAPAPPTDKQEEKSRTQQSNKIFGDLFNGESAPVHLGIPTSPAIEEDDGEIIMEYRSQLTEGLRPSHRLQRAETNQSNSSTSTTPRAPRTSWFAKKPTTPPKVPSPSSPAASDELVSINLNKSLFPRGAADPLSPHAFNDLLLNATSLLQRMQDAYKEKVDFIASMQPEMDTQKEEVEEAKTRSRHLKIQLEDVARKAEEQVCLNRELADQLAEQKLRSQEAHERALRVCGVRTETESNANDESAQDNDDTTPRRKKRSSAGSASDSGFESDADNSSVLSRGSRSTAATDLASVSRSPPPRISVTPDLWTPRLVKNTSKPESALHQHISSSGFGGMRLGSEGAAWATVEKLRSENQMLRHQMDEMQRTLQGCIDFVDGVTGSL